MRILLLILAVAVTTLMAQDVLMQSNSSDPNLLWIENTGGDTKTGIHVDSVSTGIFASGGEFGIWSESHSHNGWFNTGLHVEGTQETSGDTRGIDAYAFGGDFNFGVTSTVFGRSGATNYGFYANLEPAEGAHNYGIYTTVPNDTANNYAGYFNGKVVVTANCACTPSDGMFKKNIQPLSGELEKIMALRPKSYEMKTEEFRDRIYLGSGRQMGFVAQDVQIIFPELVDEITAPVPPPTSPTKNGPAKSFSKREPLKFKAMNYTGLIPVLVRAVQEQQAIIESMKTQVNALNAKVAMLNGK